MTRYFLLLVGGFLICAQAQAQTMYRCGSVYQDRPCDAGQKSKAVGSTGTGAPAAQAGGVDAECVQRGRDSNKVIWAREGGATQERLMSEAKTAAERRTIQDAYRRPGAASTVQAAIEAECAAAKQADRDTARAIAAALKASRQGSVQEGNLPPPAAIPSMQVEPADPAAQAQRDKQQAARAEERKKSQCASYNRQMDDLRSQERGGGSASSMDRLNAERRNLRDQMSRAGC
jgi:hypothetical protein